MASIPSARRRESDCRANEGDGVRLPVAGRRGRGDPARPSRSHATVADRPVERPGEVGLWFPAETQFVRMDGRRYLAAESNGTYHVLDADGGTVIASQRLVEVKHCLQVHVTGDENRFYVAFSDTFGDARNFRANGQRDQSRNPLVSGGLVAWIATAGRRFGAARFSTPCLLLINRGWPRFWSFRTGNRDAAQRTTTRTAWHGPFCIASTNGQAAMFSRTIWLPTDNPKLRGNELGRREVMVSRPDASVRFRYSR